jgi:5-hydroxyisourate hydrolase
MTSPITTHVLDTTRGRPAEGVAITLERRADDGVWSVLGRGATDADGRLRDLLPEGALVAGTYRITFDTGGYQARQGVKGFYPEASIVFDVEDASGHYHVPLLLNPFGYATYRGS